MASLFSTTSQIAAINTRARSGVITLPLTTTSLYRQIMIKDLYGAFPLSTLTLSTQSGDYFEDGTSTRILCNAFEFQSLYAGSTSRWHTVAGTQWTSMYVSSLRVDSLQLGSGDGWADFGPLRATAISSLQIVTGLLQTTSISTLGLSTGTLTACNISTSSLSTNFGFASNLSATTLGISGNSFMTGTLIIGGITTHASNIIQTAGTTILTGLSVNTLSTNQVNSSNICNVGWLSNNGALSNLTGGAFFASISNGTMCNAGLLCNNGVLSNLTGGAFFTSISNGTMCNAGLLCNNGVLSNLTSGAFFASISNGTMCNAGLLCNNGVLSNLTGGAFFQATSNTTTLGVAQTATFASNITQTGGTTTLSGLSVNTISTNFIVASNISVISMSTSYGFFSTISAGNVYGKHIGDGSLLTGLPVSATPQVLSSLAFYTSSISSANVTSAQAYISSLTVDSLSFGFSNSYMSMGDIITTSVSSIQIFTSSLLTNNLQVGTVSSLSYIAFPGLQQGYTQTVIAEQATATGVQELLIFRGSTTTDRIRMQTTGPIVFEPGVSARTFPATGSNATPAMIITTGSNVGIGVAAPGLALDVAGAGRFTAVSTNTLSTNQVNSSNICNVGWLSNNGALSNLTGGAFFASISNGTMCNAGLLCNNGVLSNLTGGAFFASISNGTMCNAGLLCNNGVLSNLTGGSFFASISNGTMCNAGLLCNNGVLSNLTGGAFFASISNGTMCNAGLLCNNGVLSNLTGGAFFQATSNTTTLGVAQTATFASNITQTGGTTTLSGLSVNTISTNFVVASNISVISMSTSYGFFSTISAGNVYGKHIGDGSLLTGLPVSATPQVLSSLAFYTSSISSANITSAQGYISSLTVDYLAIGSNYGYVNMGDIIATSLSSIAIESQTLTTSNLKVGIVSSLSYIAFPGLQQGYTQSVVAEQSTGTGLQELLIFRGSTTTDRIRMQTTGSIIFEPGVSARVFPAAPSNATPAMIITTGSNVGIGIAAPGLALDVAGAGRFTAVSTNTLSTNQVNSSNICNVGWLSNGGALSNLGGTAYFAATSNTTTLGVGGTATLAGVTLTSLSNSGNFSNAGYISNGGALSNLGGTAYFAATSNTTTLGVGGAATFASNVNIYGGGFTTNGLTWTGGVTHTLWGDIVTTGGKYIQWDYTTGTLITDNTKIAITAPIINLTGTTTLGTTYTTTLSNSGNFCNAGWLSNGGALSNLGGTAYFTATSNTTTLGVAQTATFASNITQAGGTTTLTGLSVNTISTNFISACNISSYSLSTTLGYFSTISSGTFYGKYIGDGSGLTGISGSGGTGVTNILSTNQFFTSSISTATIQTSNIRVGTLSTNSYVSYPGLAQQYTQSILAEQGTGTGLQEMLIFRGSSASDRIRLQTTGYIVFETGVGARVYPTITSNVTPSWMIDVNGCVGVGIIPSGTATKLDVAGQGRFQNLSTTSIQAGSMNLSVAFV